MHTTENPTTPGRDVDPAAAFAIALAKFQAELPVIRKTREGQDGNRKFKYADITDVVRTCAPPLAKLGLAVTSRTTIRDGRTILVTKLVHVDGHHEESEIDVTAQAGNMKILGSNITYARRYAYGALTGIVTDEDTDATGTSVAEYAETPSQPMATPDQINTLNANGAMVGHIMYDTIGRDDANASNITRAEADKLITEINRRQQ